MQVKTVSLNIVLGLFFLGLAQSANAQINKHLVEQAPKEERAPMPHINPDDPTTLPLRQDESTHIWRTPRDPNRNPDRTPGPIDIQRYGVQLEPVGIKTFFHLPVAFDQQDLIAGEVDVAIFGAPTGALPHSAGAMWAPASVRYTTDYGGYGVPEFPLSWIEYETLINPFSIIKAVDYGDAALNPYSQAQTLEDIRRMTREVAETGAVPFAVGGDHSVPNGTFRGIIDVYGRDNVAFVHFDVHLDRGTGEFGAWYHAGTYMDLAVQEGLISGDKIIQYGMATPVFGEHLYDQILKEGGKVYHIHEIKRDGVDATFDKIYEDLKDVDLVYISFDIDTFDMSYAPGVGSASPIGSHPEDLFPQLREFAARKTIVGFDIVEFQPFYDNRGQQTARLVRRTMFQILTGIAMRKAGMDPEYVNPRIKGEP